MLYSAASKSTATETDWEKLYFYDRAELLARSGAQHQDPNEQARRSWEAVSFPMSTRYREDLEEVFDEIAEKRRRMFETGGLVVSADGEVDEASVRKELQDLRQQVSLGASFASRSRGEMMYQGSFVSGLISCRVLRKPSRPGVERRNALAEWVNARVGRLKRKLRRIPG